MIPQSLLPFLQLLLLVAASSAPGTHVCSPAAGCNVCEYCCNEFIPPTQCLACASSHCMGIDSSKVCKPGQCTVCDACCQHYITDSGCARCAADQCTKLTVSKKPHLYTKLSFNLDRYDRNAKALFGAFVVGVIVCSLFLAAVIGTTCSKLQSHTVPADDPEEGWSRQAQPGGPKTLRGDEGEAETPGAGQFWAAWCCFCGIQVVLVLVLLFSLCLSFLPTRPR